MNPREASAPGLTPAPASEPEGAPPRAPVSSPTTRDGTSPSPPTRSFLHERRGGGRSATWTATRLLLRFRGDPQLLLAVAIAVPVLALEGSAQLVHPWIAALIPTAFVFGQVLLTGWRNAPTWLPSARLGISLAFVGFVNAWLDPTGTWPLSALAIPVVTLAAATGGTGPTVVALAGMGLMLTPLASPGADPATRPETLALVIAAGVVALGSRRVVADLERSTVRLRQANKRDRRHARQLAAVEEVGRLLAREGPNPGTLDSVMGVLEGTFGYEYPSVYVWDGQALQLGAQRNYRFPIQTVTPDRGVLGRIARTREPAFLPDARIDPDFLSGDPNVMSEIGVPLQADGQLLGILNVETSGRHRLDADDLATMEIVGDRLAAALALGRERQKLTERAALLDRFTTFATVLSSSLDPARMQDQVTDGAGAVIPAEMVVLIEYDEAVGYHVITSVAGGDPSVLGQVIRRGEGVSGTAMDRRSVIVRNRIERNQFPKSVSGVNLPDTLAGMAAPMLVGDAVAGVVTWIRADLGQPFSVQEQEVAALLAGRVGLALANARLHEKMQNAAITDPLTGLHNRRHFDAVLERDDAIRRRIPAERRRLRSVILFDLDHFGQVNKRFGHQVGDRVLRLFADTVRSRARSSDLVARYGGEEFVVILDNASREEAASIADDIRAFFSQQPVDTGTGDMLTTTVSAGCATLEQWEVEGALLLERADVALAMAKAGGRDQVVAA